MILSSIVLAFSLLAVSVSGSAIKGREEYPSKGGRQLAGPAAVGYQLRPYNYEQQRQEAYATKGQEVRRADEAPAEQTKPADSEHAYQEQRREETKSERQQFYEAQPQLRTEEQVVATETKYEARPQVREEAQGVAVVAAGAAVPVAAAKGPVYSKTEERRDDQVQYAPSGPQAAAPQPEQRKLVEEVQRMEEIKGQRGYAESAAQREESKSSQVSKAAEAATVQRIEEQKFEQQEQQQAVELTKQEHYEQRRFEEQSEQRSEEQVVQVREEAGLKGGLRAAGAEAEPYAFDYSVEGSSRRESGDQYGVVRGQYTIQNPDGSQRVVDYVADQDGFRAQVQSNEFGTEAQQPANVALRSSQQPSGDFARLDTKSVVHAAVPVAVVPVVAAAPAPAPVPVPVPVSAPAAVDFKSAPQPIVQVAAAAPVPEVARGVKSFAETVQQPYERASADQASFRGRQVLLVDQEQAQQAPTVYAKVQSAEDGHRSAKSAFKSAELRATPESAEPLLARASSFESATAHRPVVHSHPVPAAVVRHVVPPSSSSVVPVVRHHLPAVPVAPGRRDRHPRPQHQHLRPHSYRQPSSVVPVAVSRAQLQHDRYPPTLRRHDHLTALNPRVSFYASNNNFDDEQPAGFEHPAEHIL